MERLYKRLILVSNGGDFFCFWGARSMRLWRIRSTPTGYLRRLSRKYALWARLCAEPIRLAFFFCLAILAGMWDNALGACNALALALKHIIKKMET